MRSAGCASAERCLREGDQPRSAARRLRLPAFPRLRQRVHPCRSRPKKRRPRPRARPRPPNRPPTLPPPRPQRRARRRSPFLRRRPSHHPKRPRCSNRSFLRPRRCPSRSSQRRPRCRDRVFRRCRRCRDRVFRRYRRCRDRVFRRRRRCRRRVFPGHSRCRMSRSSPYRPSRFQKLRVSSCPRRQVCCGLRVEARWRS